MVQLRSSSYGGIYDVFAHWRRYGRADQGHCGNFGLDNTTTSRHTRQFLQLAEQEGQVVSAAEDLPKSLSPYQRIRPALVYLTQFNAATLEKRLHISGVSQRTGSTQKNQPAAEGRCKPFRRCRLI